jgi:hypothetical protein
MYGISADLPRIRHVDACIVLMPVTYYVISLVARTQAGIRRQRLKWFDDGSLIIHQTILIIAKPYIHCFDGYTPWIERSSSTTVVPWIHHSELGHAWTSLTSSARLAG